MIYTFEDYAEEGSRFSADAFDSQLGKEISVKADPLEETTGTILGVTVSEDGTAAAITIEIPDDSAIAKLISGVGLNRLS